MTFLIIILTGSNTLHIRFVQIYRFIRISDRNKCFTLFGSEKYDAVYDYIRYLISLKSGIAFIFSQYFEKVKIDSLPIQKILALNNVIILTKLTVKKDENHFFDKVFLEIYSQFFFVV